jgi:predicted aldo/keto reductase-like oxidoreductase
LRRLRTDRIDLWQFHGIKRKDDPDLIFDPKNGALKAALEAQKAGKVRYIGFTGHQHPDLHLDMLSRGYEWASVMLPLNVCDAHYLSFQKDVVPVCNKRNIAVIGMKALASQNGRIVRDLNISAQDARRYVLSLPISTLVCGIASRRDLNQDVNMARSFSPMSEDEVVKLLARSEDESQDGHIEQYKIGNYGCDWYHNNA